MKGCTLQLEYSLLSVSKWEAEWKKPFLQKTKKQEEKTREETIDYIRCMTITKNVSNLTYMCIDDDTIKKISSYINDSQSATWFVDTPDKKASREIYTSERIYAQMVNLRIPAEYQKWHLNRLLNLIRIVSDDNQPKKKMNKRQVAEQQRVLNEQRKAAMKTSG